MVTLALASLLVPGSAGAEPAAAKGALLQFRCEGFLGFVPADAVTTRSVGDIPAEFKLAGEDYGRAIVGVGAWDCDWAVDGDRIGRSDYSHVSVTTESHPGSYDIWQFTQSPRLHAAATQIGVFQPLLPDLDVTIEHVAGFPLSGRATVPWEQSPYEMTATIPPSEGPFFRALDACGPIATPTTDPAGCFASDHWYKGPQGTVYTAHANCDVYAGSAEVIIETPPGSPLARIIGGERVDVPGVWLRMDASAWMDYASRFTSGEAARPECEALS